MMTDRLATALFIVSLMIAAFLYGFASHRFELFPYPVLKEAHDAFTASRKPSHYLRPIRYDTPGVRIHDRDAVSPGVTLITTLWPDRGWKPGIRLIDIDGNTLHHWDIEPDVLWPEDPNQDGMPGKLNIPDNYAHGSYLFPNGDVMFNIEYLGLVRLDRCGNTVWKLPYRTHHSISRDEDGNFWVSGAKWRPKDDTHHANRFPGITPPFTEDFAVKVSPDGRILREISLLDAIFAGGHQHLFWKKGQRTGDITHLNDVEPLSSELAPHFPLFEAGDLVVSMKHINAVAVLDRSGHIKWIDSHHFHRQHDPDFEEGGRIVVFDNREDGTDRGEFLGGSAITSIDPVSRETQRLYPVSDDQPFFTLLGGKHRRLPNGNRLITETAAARVFEIDAEGRVVWEWVHQPFDAKTVTEVMEGMRYDIDPATVSTWRCH